MNPLLEVEDLSIAFGARTVVSGVSFSLEAGECLAIVGESGSGKSVTARALLGLAGEGSRVRATTMRFDDTAILDASPQRLRSLRGREIGLVSQGALVALDPLRPIGREVADALRLHTSMTAAQRADRAIELLAEAGLPEPELRYGQRPDELSGGMRQRAVIASAIAMRPRLLIADEPTTALDTTVQARILELLERLRAQGAAILLISHDLAVVSRIASRIAVMQGGSIVEAGTTENVLSSPQHPYTRSLIAAVPASRPRGSLLGSGDLTPAPAPEPPTTEAVLVARGVSLRFGPRQAVHDVSLSLRRGTTLGIVGESGSGKTTLARLCLALARPDSGDVEVLGAPWSSLSERERRAGRRRIGAIYQDALSSFDPRFTVGQILADALSGGRTRRAGAEVNELLEQVGLAPELARRRPRLLSGGQQQRVAIARAIAPWPDILVCDEPVSSLDVLVQAQVLDLLDEIQRARGLSYLFISHDLGVVRHMSDSVLVMRHGRVVESGPTEDVFSAPRHDYTRELIAAAPRLT
ncbi:ABC transporter ATP-binding protein [Parafrigoribacterium soli]|uniref:ABC transporter ATP-binding protein n=1 Tax=Parafrigoribacterium soli TaxID=3144663 RepID=UPI0032F0458C